MKAMVGPRDNPPDVSRDSSDTRTPSDNAVKPLIDVHIDKPGLSRGSLYFMVICGVSGGASAFLISGLLSGMTAPLARGMCTGAFIVLILAIAMRFGQKRMERRLSDLIGHGSDGDVALLARKVARQSTELTRKQPVSEMVRRLALVGRVGETIRLAWSGTLEAVEPLGVAFDPRPLDQANPAFEEIDSAFAPVGEEDHSPHSEPRPTQRDDVLAVRRIRRNVSLKGGWIAVGILAVFFLGAVWESYKQRTMTWGVPFWGALLVLASYGPVTGGFFGTQQWFVVPGGLVVRKARWRDRTSRVHLFERRTSVLCVNQVRRRVWIVTAADADAYETTVGTKKEIDLLLRAWLSPLSPPSAERLTDLT
ncbi:MAG: hypothetical protein JXQ75_13745 [Phycisphaerae bacterium]|nr:hypothetical protein [Phycisphaerae bacterium]